MLLGSHPRKFSDHPESRGILLGMNDKRLKKISIIDLIIHQLSSPYDLAETVWSYIGEKNCERRFVQGPLIPVEPAD